MEDALLNTLRLMKFEEAKGALKAALRCYYRDPYGGNNEYDEHEKIVREIIQKIEDELE